MGYLAPIRARLEAIVAGEYATSTSRMIQSGRFHRTAPGGRVEDQPHDSVERAFEVVVRSPGRPIDGANTADPVLLMEHQALVRIGYARTDAGTDATEMVGEQDGAGTLEAIRDRAGTDAWDLAVALGWYENWAGLDPALFDVEQPDGTPGQLIENDTRCVLELPLTLRLQVTQPGSYAP